jgi:beta-N-acetylhexosaminidase
VRAGGSISRQPSQNLGVELRGPYDASAAPRIGTFLAVYGDRPIHLQAAAEALFGTLQPTGSVP